MNGVWYYTNGVMTDQWNDDASTYTQWDPTGALIRGPIAYSALTTGDPAYAVAQDAANRAAAVTAASNYQKIQQAIVTQRANNTTFLGIQSPTTAQVIAQVQALTRQNNAMMRLWANDLTGTN